MHHLQNIMKIAPEQLINQTASQGKFNIKGDRIKLEEVTGEYQQVLLGTIISKQVPFTFHAALKYAFSLSDLTDLTGSIVPCVVVGVRNQLS